MNADYEGQKGSTFQAHHQKSTPLLELSYSPWETLNANGVLAIVKQPVLSLFYFLSD